MNLPLRKLHCFLPISVRRSFYLLNALPLDTLEAPADFTILLLLASGEHTAPYTGVESHYAIPNTFIVNIQLTELLASM